jgi:hypothetical protein
MRAPRSRSRSPRVRRTSGPQHRETRRDLAVCCLARREQQNAPGALGPGALSGRGIGDALRNAAGRPPTPPRVSRTGNGLPARSDLRVAQRGASPRTRLVAAPPRPQRTGQRVCAAGAKRGQGVCAAGEGGGDVAGDLYLEHQRRRRGTTTCEHDVRVGQAPESGGGRQPIEPAESSACSTACTPEQTGGQAGPVGCRHPDLEAAPSAERSHDGLPLRVGKGGEPCPTE